MPRSPSPLQQELRQIRPFRSDAHEASVALLRTADMLRGRMSALTEQEAITLQQYNVLRILRGAGKEGLPTLEIAGRMIERAPGITRLLDRLEARRLVVRERCPTDRRQVTCRITSSGLAVLERLDGPVAATDLWFTSVLSKREIGQLVALLDRLRAGDPGSD
jgi:DNA-binding MarR family transcriptional regulator